MRNIIKNILIKNIYKINENKKINKLNKFKTNKSLGFFKSSSLVSCGNDSGRLFHNLGPRTEKALSPYPLVRDGGI